jgi:hypothetical protein
MEWGLVRIKSSPYLSLILTYDLYGNVHNADIVCSYNTQETVVKVFTQWVTYPIFFKSGNMPLDLLPTAKFLDLNLHNSQNIILKGNKSGMHSKLSKQIRSPP